MARTATKTELSRDAILDRALAVADAEGLDAVTIRRLAQDLGVTPMALYWHVRSKDELLDAMGDRLYADLSYDIGPDAPWDERLGAVMRTLVDALRRHPACLELAYRRILACPEGLAITEYTLRLLREQGFTPRQTANLAMHALQSAVTLVSGEPGTGQGSPEEQAATLEQKRAALTALPDDQYPYLREMADDLLQCDDVDEYYDFNIGLFVAGARASLSTGVTPAR